MRRLCIFLIVGIFVLGIFVITPAPQAFSELFSNMELYTETLRLPTTTIDADERYMIFDTTNIANMSKVTVTTNIPCDSNGNPKLKVAVGTLDSYTSIIDSSIQNLNFTGPQNSCTFSGTVLASDENITINRIWLTPNNGSNHVNIGAGKLLTLTALLDEGNSGSVPPSTPSPDYEDDFTSNNWDTFDADALVYDGTNDELDWDIPLGGVNDENYSYEALNETLSNTEFVFRSTFKINTLSGAANPDLSAISIILSDSTNQDAIDGVGFCLNLGLSSWNPTFQAVAYNGAAHAYCAGSTESTFATSPTAGTTYYIEIIRSSATTLTVELFSDSSFSTSLEKETLTISSSYTNFDNIIITVYDGNAGDYTVDGTIDDLKIWDAVSSPP